MNKYKCTSRFSILLFVDGQVQEFMPGQEYETETIITHPFLSLITPDIKIKKTYESKKSKKLNTKDKKDTLKDGDK